MEDHIHMKFAKIIMIIIGLWPVKLEGWQLKMYNAYFYTSYIYYIIYDITQLAMVYLGDANFLEAAGNLGVTIVYIINIYKVFICRSAPVRTILEEIETKEKLILNSSDEEIKKIYHDHVNSALLSMKYYVSLGSVGISLYFVTPMVRNFLEENEHKVLIFSSWFPFDSDENYVLAYMIQFFGGFYGYSYIVYCGAFLFCILKYCVGQIRILQHVFRNLNQYIVAYSKENNISKVDGEKQFVKKCIKEHQYIISLVDRLDNCIKTFMLLEFVISSFQLSLVVLSILQSSGFGVARMAVLSYFVTLCSQLFIFYWNAHEIIFESIELGQAVLESEWYTLDLKTQKMLQFVILRAQKPIGISIGPIYEVKVDALIGIFKAIYSYVAVIRK